MEKVLDNPFLHFIALMLGFIVVFFLSALIWALFRGKNLPGEHLDEPHGPSRIIYELHGPPSRIIFINERNEERERIMAEFCSSSEYDLICRFVARYGWENYQMNNGMESFEYLAQEVQHLIDLLQPKWCFDELEIRDLLKSEGIRQKEEAAKAKLLSSGSHSYEEYCRAYLEHYGTNDEHLSVLQQILLDAGLWNDSIGAGLLNDLVEQKKKIELDRFRNRLYESEEEVRYPCLSQMDGQAFERFLAEMFERMGYEVITTPATGDQGADLIVDKLGERVVVQAKHWASTVGNTAVQEVTAAVRHYGAHRAMVITTSTFSPGAIELARSNGVELVDRIQLEKMIRENW